jgi:hypothetical protein
MSDWISADGLGVAGDNPGSVFARVWELYETGRHVIACAWCGRVRLDDRWFEVPHAALDAIDAANVLSHSICEECALTTQS